MLGHGGSSLVFAMLPRYMNSLTTTKSEQDCRFDALHCSLWSQAANARHAMIQAEQAPGHPLHFYAWRGSSVDLL